MFKIVNFGNDSHCKNAQEVLGTLIDDYMGQSVSVIISMPSGIKHTLFVDVDMQGKVTDSYTSKRITLEALKNIVE